MTKFDSYLGIAALASVSTLLLTYVGLNSFYESKIYEAGARLSRLENNVKRFKDSRQAKCFIELNPSLDFAVSLGEGRVVDEEFLVVTDKPFKIRDDKIIDILEGRDNTDYCAEVDR
ncbi:hypothetical protein J4216_00615 [Candidatus Woesearchaeota archaeon]|nr:hypothetical protein [Candidatus Woesearchaeota archaeon]